MRSDELYTYLNKELKRAALLTEEDARLAPLSYYIFSAIKDLNSRLRLAIIGRTKGGKSTLTNALLHTSILPMGKTVTTDNICVLHHVSMSPCQREMVVVHLMDETSPVQMEIEKLPALLDKNIDDPQKYRERIKEIEVYLDNPALEEMDIIDCPGDDSASGRESIKTKQLLADEERRPHILVYVVLKESTDTDLKSIVDYQKNILGNNLNSLNIIMAFNRCDLLLKDSLGGWRDWSKCYKEEGLGVIENARGRSAEFRRSFSKGFPTAAIFALASGSITTNDFDILKKTSRHQLADDFSGSFDLDDFKNIKERYPDLCEIFGTDIDRQSMLDRLGLDAMQYIVWWCMKNPNGSIDQLRQDLDEYSNVPAMRRYIFEEHFKKLSVFYKATSAIPTLKMKLDYFYDECHDNDTKVKMREVLEICVAAKKTLYNKYGFLSLLYDYYNHSDYFSEEEWGEAERTIYACISDDTEKERKKQFLSYWEEKLEYYSLISDSLALETTNKLLKSLHNNE